MTKYAKGDKLLLHSQNGRDYKIIIVNVNPYREPGTEYAVDTINDQGVSYYSVYGDWLFCGEELFDKCVLDEEGIKMDKKVLDVLFHQLYNARIDSKGAPTGNLLEAEEDLHCFGVAAWKQAGNHGYAFRLKGETVTHFWYLGKGVV